ncbi:MAG: hypothetical protein AAGF13_08590, partial [Pseudomonadota bacterium]
PEVDFARIVRLTTARLLRPPSLAAIHLAYVLGFVRFAGPPVSARSVDRDNTGYTYSHGWQRADETMVYLFDWIDNGIDSERSQAEARKVQQWHLSVAQNWPMPAHTYQHSAAAFVLLFDRLITQVIGAKGLTEKERQAQLIHWTKVSHAMGVRDIPSSWEGIVELLERYETPGVEFNYSKEGNRLATTLVDQWATRFFPRGFHWMGRWLCIALIEDHIVECLEMPRPPGPFIWLTRRFARILLWLGDRYAPDPPEIPQFGRYLRDHPRSALRRRHRSHALSRQG